jgi:hypothetical protein
MGRKGPGGAEVIAVGHEIINVLRLAVFRELEIILCEAANEMPAVIVHHYVDIDDATGDMQSRVRGRSRGLGDCGAEKETQRAGNA